MFIIYDLIFFFVALVYFPFYFLKGKFHRGFSQRLGFLPSSLKLDRPVWIHAVSLGEALSAKLLLQEMRRSWPLKKFVISTVTPTGNKIAKTLAQEQDLVIYLPLDFSFIVNSVLKRINPSLFVILETELWPNLITSLYRRNIPVAVVNTRISDGSFRGYKLIRFFLRPIVNRVNLFCAQTQRDAQRLLILGVLEEKIRVTGNLKFDIVKDFPLQNSRGCAGKEYRLKLGLTAQEKLFIAGSTHPGEEEIILSAYKDLLKDYPGLKLLIAPRHPQRASDLEALVKKFNFTPLRISLLRGQPEPGAVFLLDTVGELMSYYAASDIVFVGGSLIRRGGHNILEPAMQAKPVLFGPYMFNFRDIADLFLDKSAAILIHNQDELKEKMRFLLDHPDEAAQLCRRGREVILSNQGSTARDMECIWQLTKSTGNSD